MNLFRGFITASSQPHHGSLTPSLHLGKQYTNRHARAIGGPDKFPGEFPPASSIRFKARPVALPGMMTGPWMPWVIASQSINGTIFAAKSAVARFWCEEESWIQQVHRLS